LGGTFDYLHLGHEVLLVMAVLAARVSIVVGLTGGNMLVNKKNREIIQNYDIRRLAVEEYIHRLKPELKV
jgi:pantetheine-phosphate adenylyltransferase